jgi:4-amino-4-deoxy-L-arabinose transferase-like glycosyltransferase
LRIDQTSVAELLMPDHIRRRPCRANFQFIIFNFQFSILLILCGFLFFWRLADRDLWSSHEPRAAQDAQTMLSDGDWGLPHLFDRKVELQKPPLYYWLVAAVAELRGGDVDAWAVRLPAAAAALGGVLLVYAWGVGRRRPLAGFLAGVFLATSLHYTWLARTGRIDMPLAFTVSLSLAGFCQARNALAMGRHAVGWLGLAYAAAALGVLLKGPIGLVLPAVTAGAFLLIEKDLPGWRDGRGWLRLVRAYRLGWGVLVVLALVLPWHTWANAQTHGQLVDVFFWKHNFERGFGGGALRSHPWWFYGPRLAGDLLPWSPLVVVAGWLLQRRGWWREDSEARLGATWFVVMVLLLSCMSFKRADYLLPAYPGAALLLGFTAERWYRQACWKRTAALGLGMTVMGVLIGWGIYLGVVIPRQDARYAYQEFAKEIRKCSPQPQLILFFRTEAHALAFHVGRPLDTLLEWENLDVWVGRPEIYHVVMPSQYAREWPRHLKAGRLEEVLTSNVLAGANHDDPLVLLRSRPGTAAPVP